MRKLLYVVLGLVAIVPAADAAGCGGSNDATGGGGASAGPGGGQVQDFDYSIKVTWTIFGMAPTQSLCQGDQVVVRLSGTEDPSLHAEKTGDCTGSVTLTGLTRLRSGASPYVEGFLQNPAGMNVLAASASVVPSPGEVRITLAFVAPDMSTTTTGPGGTGGSGTGGSSGMGGAGGTATTSSAGGASSSSAAASSSSMASSGSG